MLRIIKRLKQDSPLTIKANFLGAHAIHKEFKENSTSYIDLIINLLFISSLSLTL